MTIWLAVWLHVHGSLCGSVYLSQVATFPAAYGTEGPPIPGRFSYTDITYDISIYQGCDMMSHVDCCTCVFRANNVH